MAMNMIKTTFVPEEFLYHVADEQMTPVVLKAVPVTVNYTVTTTNDYMVVLTPNRLSQNIGQIYNWDPQNLYWGKVSDIVLSQEISTSFNQGRLISGCFDLFSSTIASGTFQLSGVINGIRFDNQLPPISEIDFQTLLQYNSNASSKIQNVPVADGIHALVLPQGTRPFRTLEYENTTIPLNAVKEVSRGRDQVIQWLLDTIPHPAIFQQVVTDLPPGVYQMTISYRGNNAPTGATSTDWLELTVNACALSASLEGPFRTAKCRTDVVQGTDAINYPTASYTLIFTADEVFKLGYRFLGTPNGLLDTGSWNVELTHFEGAEPNTFPGQIYILNNMTAGQTVTLTGMMNYELIPNRNLIKDLPAKTGEYNPEAMMALNCMLSKRQKYEVRDIYLRKEWPAQREKFKEIANLSADEIKSAMYSTSGIFSFLRPLVNPLYHLAGTLLGVDKTSTSGYTSRGFAKQRPPPLTTSGYARMRTTGLDDVIYPCTTANCKLCQTGVHWDPTSNWSQDEIPSYSTRGRSVVRVVYDWVSKLSKFFGDRWSTSAMMLAYGEPSIISSLELDEDDERKDLIEKLQQSASYAQMAAQLTKDYYKANLKPEEFRDKIPEFYESLGIVLETAKTAQKAAAKVKNYLEIHVNPKPTTEFVLRTSGPNTTTEWLKVQDYIRDPAKLPIALKNRSDPYKVWHQLNVATKARRPGFKLPWVEVFAAAVSESVEESEEPRSERGVILPVLLTYEPVEGYTYQIYENRYVSTNRKTLPEIREAIKMTPVKSFITFMTDGVVAGSSSGLAVAAAGMLRRDGFSGMVPAVFTGTIGVNGSVIPVLDGPGKLKAASENGMPLIGSTLDKVEMVTLARVRDVRAAIEHLDYDKIPEPAISSIGYGYVRTTGIEEWAFSHGVQNELHKLFDRLAQPDGPDFLRKLVSNSLGGVNRETNQQAGLAGQVKYLRSKGQYVPGMTAEDVATKWRDFSTQSDKYQAYVATNPQFGQRVRVGKYNNQPAWLQRLMTEDQWESFYVRNGRKGPNEAQLKKFKADYEQQFGRFGAASKKKGLQQEDWSAAQAMMSGYTGGMQEQAPPAPQFAMPTPSLPLGVDPSSQFVGDWVNYYNANGIPYNSVHIDDAPAWVDANVAQSSGGYMPNVQRQVDNDTDPFGFGGFDE